MITVTITYHDPYKDDSNNVNTTSVAIDVDTFNHVLAVTTAASAFCEDHGYRTVATIRTAENNSVLDAKYIDGVPNLYSR